MKFQLKQRVQLAPHTDLWMQGARYGEVIKVDKAKGTIWPYCVKPDNQSKRPVWVAEEDIQPI